MKIETPKKVDKNSVKWEEHMNKKPMDTRGGEAEITHAKKKESVQAAKGKVAVKVPAKEPAKAGAKKAVAQNAKKEKIGVAKIADEISVEEKLTDLEILKHPLVTEKAVNMIEGENKLTFVVDKKATKPAIKGAVESLYKVRVKKIGILNDMKARKRAIVTLHKEFKASEIATKLGVI